MPSALRPNVEPTPTADLGRGLAQTLRARIEATGVSRLALVVDPQAFAATNAETWLGADLDKLTVSRFAPRHSQPVAADAEELAAAMRAHPIEGVLAFGGGTAIDVAKLGVALEASGGDLRTLLTDGLPPEAITLPLFACPTTAGNGAEATRFAVAYVDGVKHSVDDPRLRPCHAFVDARFTDNLPTDITAHTGWDALCQATESLWASGATTQSREEASRALRLAVTHLENAVRSPSPTSRDGMAEAAHRAGRAIDITRTTLPHALSYHLTSAYGVPHGQAVAVFLAPALMWLAATPLGDGALPDAHGARATVREIIQAFGTSDPEIAANRITTMLRRCGMAVSLCELGVTTQEQRRALAASANPARLANFPLRMTPDDLIRFVEAMR